jgi:hypothetical protein
MSRTISWKRVPQQEKKMVMNVDFQKAAILVKCHKLITKQFSSLNLNKDNSEEFGKIWNQLQEIHTVLFFILKNTRVMIPKE